MLFCNTFSATEVRIITENPHFAARLPKLFRRAFNLQFDRQPEPEQEEGKRIFQITDQKKLDHIINLLGFDPQQNLVLHINFGMVEETCDRAAFLRGAFFAGGSITDPQKRYHLELTTSHLQVSRELGSLLQECGYPPKSLSRGGSLITYFKQSDQIEDFLTLIGAPVAAMNVMSARTVTAPIWIRRWRRHRSRWRPSAACKRRSCWSSCRTSFRKRRRCGWNTRS